MIRLLFFSRNLMQEKGLPIAQEIKGILDKSRVNNTNNGITGALLFNNAFFAQVIEGERKIATETFLRVSRDPRHKDVQIVDVSTIEERMFTQWSLAFAGRSSALDELYLRYGESEVFSPSRLAPVSFVKLIKAITEIEDHVVKARIASNG